VSRRRNKPKFTKPDWFDLFKYELLKSIPLEGWYHEIKARQYLLNECSDDNYYIGLRRLIRQTGLVLGLFYPAAPPESLNEIQPDKKWVKDGFKTNCVRLSTCRDIAILQLEDHIVEACLRSDSMSDEFDAHVPYDIYAISHIDENQVDYINLTINLNAPNPVLIRDFETVLKAARNNFDIQSKTKVSDLKVNSWLSQQLLPYLDLYIWMEETGNRIPPEIISEWLYPDLYENENNNPGASDEGRKVVRTTHPNAMELISDVFLVNLELVLKSQGVYMKSDKDFKLKLSNLLKLPEGGK